MGQTVNLLVFTFGGSNPSPPTQSRREYRIAYSRVFSSKCGNSSVDRALAFQAGGRGFEPRFPLYEQRNAVIAQW